MSTENPSILFEDINGVAKEIHNANDYFCDDYQSNHILNPPDTAVKHARKAFRRHDNLFSDTDGNFFEPKIQ